MFYESKHSSADHLHVGEGRNFSFPPHLHEAFELIVVTEGEMTVFVEDRRYDLSAGEAVLVFPDETHSLESPGHSRHKVCIFSPKLVHAFSTARQDVVPESNFFRPSEWLFSLFLSLAEKESVFRAKGMLYLIVAEFDKKRAYVDRGAGKDDLLLRIFGYVGEHFSGECTLESLSATLSYSYVYLSRYFKERTGTSFTDYVCRTRINEACYRLTNSDENVTNVALACGFDSLRSFHRNFRLLTGKTPGEYRKQKTENEE